MLLPDTWKAKTLIQYAVDCWIGSNASFDFQIMSDFQNSITNTKKSMDGANIATSSVVRLSGNLVFLSQMLFWKGNTLSYVRWPDSHVY